MKQALFYFPTINFDKGHKGSMLMLTEGQKRFLDVQEWFQTWDSSERNKFSIWMKENSPIALMTLAQQNPGSFLDLCGDYFNEFGRNNEVLAISEKRTYAGVTVRRLINSEDGTPRFRVTSPAGWTGKKMKTTDVTGDSFTTTFSNGQRSCKITIEAKQEPVLATMQATW